MMMCLSLCVEQNLSLKQTIEVKQSLFLSQRLCLIQELTGNKYKPEATCPRCFKKLTALEVVSGFNTDPDDITTSCLKCGERFGAKLVTRRGGGRVECVFYCSVQALDRIRGCEELTPKEISDRNPSVYHSLLFHYGNIKNSFKKIGVNYLHDKTEWGNKVGAFLGKLPDTIIAKYANISPYKVRKMRRERGISRFLMSNLND